MSGMEIREPHASISCQELLSNEAYTYSGWLRKRSQFHSKFSHLCKIIPWFQRYVVLSNGCLYMYKNESSRKPSGAFSLCGFTKTIRAGEILQSDAPWPFKLIQTQQNQGESYLFSASSEDEMKKWMSQLTNDIYEANKIIEARSRLGPEGSDELRKSLHEKDIIDEEGGDYEQIGTRAATSDNPIGKKQPGCSDPHPRPALGVPDYPAPNPVQKQPYDGGLSRKPIPPHRPPSEAPRPPFYPVRPPPIGTESDPKRYVEEPCWYVDNLPPPPPPPKPTDKSQRASVNRNPSMVGMQPLWSEQKYIDLMGPNPDIAFWGAMLCTSDADTAGGKIQEIAMNGVYLIRISEHDGQPVLVYFAHGATRKIKIQTNKYGAYYVQRGDNFISIKSLIEFYKTTPMPSKTPSSVCLTTPYKHADRVKRSK